MFECRHISGLITKQRIKVQSKGVTSLDTKYRLFHYPIHTDCEEAETLNVWDIFFVNTPLYTSGNIRIIWQDFKVGIIREVLSTELGLQS